MEQNKGRLRDPNAGRTASRSTPSISYGKTRPMSPDRIHAEHGPKTAPAAGSADLPAAAPAAAAKAVPAGRRRAAPPASAEERPAERVRTGMDRMLFLIIIILISFGSIMVFSASYADAQARFGDSFHFIRKQIQWAAIGIVVMLFVSRLPPDMFRKWAIPSYVVTVVLLLVVLIIGVTGNGAQRWIAIGGLTFQPSELAKTTLVLMLAWYFSEYKDKVLDYSSKKNSLVLGVLVPFGFIGIVCGLVMLEKHLSGLIILAMIGIVVIFAAGMQFRWLAALGGLGAAGVAALAFLTDYTKRRIIIWQNPELYPLDGGWQTLQGLYAIGSGGFFGLGLRNSRQKYSYVSQPQNDFIFTIVCEELGFIGAVAVITLFTLFVWRGFTIATKAPDTFTALVVIGIVSKVVIQAILNIAVVTNSIPNTGISLPFFSYGGSSLVMLFMEMGILLSISRYSHQSTR